QTPLSEHRAKTIIMALVGSVTPTAVSYTVGGLLWGVMPLAGLIAAMGSGAAVAGAATRVMGDLFIDHFELGGGADFDLADLRGRLRARSAA
ncbi:MAG: hypothetical protein KC620_25895, partial [Myxococcales bacterium]|nr:hypothetical protein [Myxococcales bacterium]